MLLEKEYMEIAKAIAYAEIVVKESDKELANAIKEIALEKLMSDERPMFIKANTVIQSGIKLDNPEVLVTLLRNTKISFILLMAYTSIYASLKLPFDLLENFILNDLKSVGLDKMVKFYKEHKHTEAFNTRQALVVFKHNRIYINFIMKPYYGVRLKQNEVNVKFKHYCKVNNGNVIIGGGIYYRYNKIEYCEAIKEIICVQVQHIHLVPKDLNLKVGVVNEKKSYNL